MPLVCTLQLFCYVNKLSSQKRHFIFYSCHIWSPLANVMSFKKRLRKSTWSFEYLLNALSFIETQRCRTMWDLSSSLGHWQDHRILHDPSDIHFIITQRDVPATQVLSFTYSVCRWRGRKETESPGVKAKRSAEVYLSLRNTKIVYREEGAGDVRHLPLERGIGLQKQGLSVNGLRSCISSACMSAMPPCSHNNAKTGAEMKG